MNPSQQSTVDVDELFQRLEQAQADRRLPPVERWAPEHEGRIDIRIDRDNTAQTYETPSHMVGIMPDPEYVNESLTLQPGDRVYFYSDGVIEQHSASDEQFGLDRFIDPLRRSRDTSLQQSIDAGIDALSAWAQPWMRTRRHQTTTDASRTDILRLDDINRTKGNG